MWQAVIFDFDGVLVDSEPLHFRALRAALLEEGIRIDEEEYAREYLAYDDRECLRRALERHGRRPDLDLVDRLAGRKAERFLELVPEVGLFPGARELVLGLAAELPLAIASGARHDEIDTILRAGGLREAFRAIVGAEDVASGKPSPEPYLAAAGALRRWAPELKAGDCLAIEDSAPGVAAARAAGMCVLAVTNSYPREKLQAAHAVVESLAELTPARLRQLVPSARAGA